MINRLKLFIPPLFLFLGKNSCLSRYGWKGNYTSWDDAQNAAGGYDSEEILHKVKSSLLRVKHGEVIYERDGVIFNENQYSWPLVAGLMHAAANAEGELNVLDFGGSLGSTYYQNQPFLNSLKSVSWNIVEQPHFVSEGNLYFADGKLKFYDSIKHCLKKQSPRVLLLSSVMQYLESPYEMLSEVCSYNFDYIIVDRTPFTLDNKERITIQVVPPEIYKASYPCWLMGETTLKKFFNDKGYSLLSDFNALDGEYADFCFKGLLMKKDKDFIRV